MRSCHPYVNRMNLSEKFPLGSQRTTANIRNKTFSIFKPFSRQIRNAIIYVLLKMTKFVFVYVFFISPSFYRVRACKRRVCCFFVGHCAHRRLGSQTHSRKIFLLRAMFMTSEIHNGISCCDSNGSREKLHDESCFILDTQKTLHPIHERGALRSIIESSHFQYENIVRISSVLDSGGGMRRNTGCIAIITIMERCFSCDSQQCMP